MAVTQHSTNIINQKKGKPKNQSLWLKCIYYQDGLLLLQDGLWLNQKVWLEINHL